MSLYHKYRPKLLSEIVGNRSTVMSVEKLLETGFPQAIVLSGPTGCGKTTLARIIAHELDANRTDLIEVDNAEMRGIDTVRHIIKVSNHGPMYGKSRVWIIDECHQMTKDAQNALLKLLEDTPKNIYFILCTTDPGKLIKTIMGRCIQFQMELLGENNMRKLIKSIPIEETELDDEVTDMIITQAEGHPRNALQLMEKAISVPIKLRIKAVTETKETEHQSIELCRLLIRGSGWKGVSTILSGLKNEEPELIRRQVMGYCQAVLLNKDDERAGLVMEMFIEPFYNTGFPELVFACYKCIKA